MPLVIEEVVENESSLATGKVNAVCSAVYDIGLQPNNFGGDPQHQIVVYFETDRKYQSKEDGKVHPLKLFKSYNINLKKFNKGSNLFKDMKSWFGEAMTDEKMKGFDLEKLVNNCCVLDIVDKDGKSKNFNIVAILPPVKKDLKATEGHFIPKWVEDKQYESGVKKYVKAGNNPWEEERQEAAANDSNPCPF